MAEQRTIIEVLADWERAHGSLAAIMPDEWAALMEAVTQAAVYQSPRQALSAPPPAGAQQAAFWIDGRNIEDVKETTMLYNVKIYATHNGDPHQVPVYLAAPAATQGANGDLLIRANDGSGNTWSRAEVLELAQGLEDIASAAVMDGSLKRGADADRDRDWCRNQATFAALALRALAATPAPEAARVMVDMTPPATFRDRWMYEQGRLAERDPRTHRAEVIEEMCIRIKAADDAAADGDYMLDSDDCIRVIRGTWQRPLANDCPRPAPEAAPSAKEGEAHA